MVVLSHNDVQENNFLYTKEQDQFVNFKIIDFEYSSLNYRGFDLASYINESMINYKEVKQRPYY